MPEPTGYGHRQQGQCVAFVFPGQGAQAVGMGRELIDAFDVARRTYAEADQALGISLTRLCLEGPEEELTRTLNTQPSILTTSVAYLRAFEEASTEPVVPRFVAGHSLGEYTALVAAGALSFETAVRLVRERGRLMQEAGERQPSAMAAVIGLDEGTIDTACRDVCSSDPRLIIQVANLNAPGQIVISGTTEGLHAATELLKARGAKRVVPLTVSGAFHSPVMQPAAEGLKQAVAAASVSPARVPLVSNVSGSPISDVESIRRELIDQLCAPVQWQRSIERMVAEGVDTFVEFGPGQVLGGLIKRITKEASVQCINDVAALLMKRQKTV